MDRRAATGAVSERADSGVRVYPTKFKPTSSNFQGEEMSGVRFVITDRESFDSTRFGIELAARLKNFSRTMDFDRCRHLIGNRSGGYLKSGRDASFIWADEQQAAAFEERRKPFLLY